MFGLTADRTAHTQQGSWEQARPKAQTAKTLISVSETQYGSSLRRLVSRNAYASQAGFPHPGAKPTPTARSA